MLHLPLPDWNYPESDPRLIRIDQLLSKLEELLIGEYRRLLDSAYALAHEQLTLPYEIRSRIRPLLSRLHSELAVIAAESDIFDDTRDLEQRLSSLENLLDREIPFQYLAQPMLADFDSLVLIDERHRPHRLCDCDNARDAAPNTTFARLCRRWRGAEPTETSAAHWEAATQGTDTERFSALPKARKRLMLLYRAMERDELNLLDALETPPSLGADFLLNDIITIFDLTDMDACPCSANPPDTPEETEETPAKPFARSVSELRAKFRKSTYPPLCNPLPRPSES